MNKEKTYDRILVGITALLLLIIALKFGWLAVFISSAIWFLGGTQGLLFTYSELKNNKKWRNKC